MINLATLVRENTFQTLKGSAIRRYKGLVGKAVGRQYYVHKDYAAEIIPTDLLEYGIGVLQKFDPKFEYNTVMLDLARDELRFDEAPDFDTAREPHVGNFVKVDLKGEKPPYKGYSNSIWHHKWLWVRDDYKGFDVDKSKEWSKIWLSKFQEPAKGTDASWGQQLGKYGLTEGWIADQFGLIVGKVSQNGVTAQSRGTHKELPGIRGNPWRYNEYTSTVYWMAETPEDWEKSLVEKYLDKQGFQVKRHIDLGEMVASDRDAYIQHHNAAHGLFEGRGDPGDHVVFGGLRGQGQIIANIIDKPDAGDAGYGHTREMGPMRWVYYQESGVIFWHRAPLDWQKDEVVNWLTHRGYEVNGHRMYDDYYDFMKSFYAKRDKNEPIAENELHMEARATARQLEAFLQAQIKGTEWEGKVFAVGGFVRDELLGKVPKDLDIVVNKFQGGIEFTVWLGKKLGIYKPESNPVTFPTFGTANLRLDGVVWEGIDFSGEAVDAVMPRTDQYHDKETRRPTSVGFTDLAGDAKRRDLTFNAIYKNVSTGEIFDPIGGLADLKAGVVRTPSDPTTIYTDDALRMFRAIRFATQLGFNLSPEIIDGIKKNLHRLGNTSKERVRDELNKILLSKDPARGMRLLKDTGLLPYVAPDLHYLIGLTQNAHHTHDVFDHTMDVLTKTQPELVRRLMALFHDIGKLITRSETPSGVHFFGHEEKGPDMVERIMMKLKYPRVLIDAVKLGVRHHMRLKQGGPDAALLTDKALRKFKVALGEYLEHVLDVIHADNISHADASSMPNQVEAVRQRLAKLNIPASKPALPITGDDVLALGIKPGPQVGKALGAVTEAWYDNPKITREEALAIVKGMV